MSSITTFCSSSALGIALLLGTTRPARAEAPVNETAGAMRACSVGSARAMARAVAARAEAGATQASVLPNPEALVEHDRILTSGGGHETTVGLGVPLGISGQRGLRKEAARVRRAAARAEGEAGLLDQAIAFREAFVEAAAEAARGEILEEQQRALEALAGTIRALAKGGEVASFDVLRHESQSRAHRRAVSRANARARSTQRFLESWLGAPVSLPARGLEQLGGGSAVLARADAAARSEHPRVRALEQSGQAAAIEAKAARRRAIPDLGVFLGYRTVTASAGGSSATGHGFRAGLVVPLPFFDHGQGEALQADAEADVARASAAGLRRENGARSRSLSERLRLLEKSRPEVEAAARDADTLRTKARQLYAAGELSITELLDTYRAAEEARLAGVELAEEIAGARLALMRALGTQLDRRLDAACRSKP